MTRRLGRRSRIFRQRRAGATNFRGEDRELRPRRRLCQHQRSIHPEPIRERDRCDHRDGQHGACGADRVSIPMAISIPMRSSTAVQAFGPSDLHTFYDETPGAGSDGSGDCIAIVGTSDFLDSAMTRIYQSVRYSANQLYARRCTAPIRESTAPKSKRNWICNGRMRPRPAPRSIVFHLGGYLVDDITGAVNDNQCGAISISYGFCGPSPAFINGIIHPLFQQAAAQGQSVFVSSDDEGAAGLGYDSATNQCVRGNSPSVNEMSADPDVTSVGGTQFTPTFAGGNDQGYSTESAWNDVSGAGGGGASQIFAKPDYQTGPGVPNDGARDVPDISMMASPNAPGAFFGHDMSGTGQVVCCVGGTSLSAPLWAGFSRVLARGRRTDSARQPQHHHLSARQPAICDRGLSRRHQRQQWLQRLVGIQRGPRLRSGDRMGHRRFRRSSPTR